MKKCFLLLVCATAFFSLQAQLRFGVKGGFNYSSLVGTGAGDVQGKPGFHIGLLANLPLYSTLSLQAELVFSTQGTKSSASDSGDLKLNLNYFNIPVLAKIATDNGFLLETGPQFGFLASAKTKRSGDKTNVKDDFKSSDLSWVFGVGYMTSPDLGFDVRYNLGISKAENDFSTKNSVLQAGVFYFFGKKQ